MISCDLLNLTWLLLTPASQREAGLLYLGVICPITKVHRCLVTLPNAGFLGICDLQGSSQMPQPQCRVNPLAVIAPKEQ